MTEHAAPETRFESLAALRSVHLVMIERQAEDTASASPVIAQDEVTGFLERACATGAILDSSEDRQAAQRVIDYWKADLVAEYRKAAADPVPMRLAPFVPAAPDPAADQTSATGYSKEELREYIRVSALARQWRDSGSSGYLLTDDALTEAKKFIRDADIRKFVEASGDAELSREKRRARSKNALIGAMVIVMFALAGLAAFALMQRNIAFQQKALADEQSREATAQAIETREVAAKLKAALLNSQQLFADVQSQSIAAGNRLAELEQRQRTLDAVIEAFGTLVIKYRLGLNDIPLPILDETLTYIGGKLRGHTAVPGDLAPDVAKAVRALMPETTTSVFETFATGYDPEFLGLSVPLPVLSEGRQANAEEPLPYLHYSLVMDTRRRFALVAAANLDRSQLAVLPGAGQALDLDPRLPTNAQPDPSWYRATMLDVAYLVTRNDVTWEMGANDTDASVADQLLNVYPNTAPLNPKLAQRWRMVEDWIRAKHNPAAARVALLSGPLFRLGAPVGEPPVALWKIAVSVEQSQQQQSAKVGGLLVDAFLVELGPANLLAADADVEAFRTTVAKIAQLSGLSFPASLVAADRGQALLNQTDGDRLAAEVSGLDGALAADRKALAQALVSAVRDGALGPADQQKVVAALVESLKFAEAQTPTGRLNLLFVLSQVPGSSWERPDWLALKAAARRATADLTVLSKSGQLDIGAQTRPHLAKLQATLGLDVRPPQVVYFQFSGLTRDRARQVRAALQSLNWNVPGEERVEGATGANEVRYSPEVASDQKAAELLAADLDAAGLPGIQAVPNPRIKPGVLEIWTYAKSRY